MKIKDLIKDLSEYKDQDMEICVFDRNHPDRIAFNITHTSISNRYVLIEIETSYSSEVINRSHKYLEDKYGLEAGDLGRL